MSAGEQMSEETGSNLASQEAALVEPAYVALPAGADILMRPSRLFSYGALKRGMDLIFATILLVVLSPLFLVVAILIKIDSRGPVFFRQLRTGKKGKEFYMYKFRSMAVDNDWRDTSCEDKYTRVGKVIRRISIDELPQLINVVKGEMSFIGPRPWVPEYWENMNEKERGRCAVRPGITGLAVVKGRNGLTVFEKIDYDLGYVRRYSLREDLKIVFLTVKTVFEGKSVDAGKSGMRNDLDDLKAENGR